MNVPSKIVSLWDIMEKFKPDGFITALNGSVEVLRRLASGATYANEYPKAQLEAFHAKCSAMNLAVACSTIGQSLIVMQGVFGQNMGGLSAKADELLNAVSVELRKQKFLSLNADEVKFIYPETPLFESNIRDKLPSETVEDIDEAGACIGYGRYTASVFHLMRVMERCVQLLGEKLNVDLLKTKGEPKSWGNILDELDSKISKLDKNAAFTKECNEIRLNLYHVKQAWRNETMHPKRTYTLCEAVNVWNTVKAFTSQIVSVL